MSRPCAAHAHLDGCCVGCELDTVFAGLEQKERRLQDTFAERLEHLEDRIRDNDLDIQDVADGIEANFDDLSALGAAHGNLDKRIDHVRRRLDHQYAAFAALRKRVVAQLR